MQWAGEAPARTTFFHNSLYLNDDGISEAWGAALAAGHEVGNHTKNHPNGRAEGYDVAAWNEQISLCSNELSAGRDVPAGAISGFRTPFLGYNEATFGSLVAQGLSYSFPGSRRGGAGSTRVQLRSACRGQSRAFRVRGSHARLRFELRRQCRRHGRPTPGRDRGLLGLRTRQDRNAYGAPARRRRMDARKAAPMARAPTRVAAVVRRRRGWAHATEAWRLLVSQSSPWARGASGHRSDRHTWHTDSAVTALP